MNCTYEEKIMPTVLYGVETWSMRLVERRKMNMLKNTGWGNFFGVTRMGRLWNEEVRIRAEIKMELESRVDHRGLH